MRPADFRSLLLLASGVPAVVSNRVYPMVVPREQWDSLSQKPCLVYSFDSAARKHTFCGPDGLRADDLTVDAYSASYDQARALGDLVAQLDGYNGTVGSTEVVKVFLTTETDVFDVDPGLYRRVLSFIIWNRRV